MKSYYIYIMTNPSHTVLYTGMTNDIIRRVFEHKNKSFSGFTKNYNVIKLVYCEETDDVNAVIDREKQIKKWRREKKANLINEINPDWLDLSDDF